MSRRLTASVARVLLATLLFTQAALAIAACDWAVRAPAQAFATESLPSCHDVPAKNANLCLADCLSEDQSNSAPQLPVAALAEVPVLLVAVAPLLLPTALVLSDAPPPEPPARIRFHSFRI